MEKWKTLKEKSEQIEQLKKDIKEVYTLDAVFSDEEETYIGIYHGKRSKIIKLPTNINNINKDTIISQIGKWLNYASKNLEPIFKKLNISGNVYYTSYGIGYDCFMKSQQKFNTDIEMIANKLNEYGIKYSEEFSDARWVYRFRISTSNENLNKIKALK